MITGGAFDPAGAAVGAGLLGLADLGRDYYLQSQSGRIPVYYAGTATNTSIGVLLGATIGSALPK